MNTEWERDGIRYTQTAFVTRLDPGSLGFPDMQADDTAVLMVKLHGQNIAPEYRLAHATLSLRADGRARSPSPCAVACCTPRTIRRRTPARRRRGPGLGGRTRRTKASSASPATCRPAPPVTWCCGSRSSRSTKPDEIDAPAGPRVRRRVSPREEASGKPGSTPRPRSRRRSRRSTTSTAPTSRTC